MTNVVIETRRVTDGWRTRKEDEEMEWEERRQGR